MDVVQKQDRGTLTEKIKKSSSKVTETDGGKLKEKSSSKTRETVEDSPKPKKKESRKHKIRENVEQAKEPDTKKLKKKLLKANQENVSLTQAIMDKNEEIANLKVSVNSLNEILNSVPIDELRCNSSIAGTKIIELSKKNRSLRAELETTKNRVSKKDLLLQKLERDLKQSEEKYNQDLELMRKGNFMPIDDMHNKIHSLQQKLFEAKNKNVELNNQLKLAQKCLQQEVGENFNLNIMASSNQPNWRGRAQQILHLQQKVHELKERLDISEHHGSGRITSFACPSLEPANNTSGTTVTTTSRSAQNHGTTRANQNARSMSTGDHNKNNTNYNDNMMHLPGNNVATFDRFAPGVRKSEILHRAKVDALEKEISALHTQLEDHRGKILALKVRNKTLNDEVLKYKMKTSTLEEQTGFNGVNLASMNEKLNMQKYQYENRIEEVCRKLADVERQRDEAECKEDEIRGKIDNLEYSLKCKDEQIVELNNVIKKTEDDLKAVCGDFLFSCRELRKEEFIAILDSLETEKNHLLEHNKVLSERLEQERKKNENLLEQFSKQKIRISRLEAKIRDLEKELEMQMERRKRSQRINEYANSVNSIAGSLNSFVFENSKNLSGAGTDRTETDNLTQPQLMDLRNQLEFANEKIKLLEEKISHLTGEKENDLRTFQQIISNSKSMVIDTIMSQRTLRHTSIPELDII